MSDNKIDVAALGRDIYSMLSEKLSPEQIVNLLLVIIGTIIASSVIEKDESEIKKAIEAAQSALSEYVIEVKDKLLDTTNITDDIISFEKMFRDPTIKLD